MAAHQPRPLIAVSTTGKRSRTSWQIPPYLSTTTTMNSRSAPEQRAETMRTAVLYELTVSAERAFARRTFSTAAQPIHMITAPAGTASTPWEVDSDPYWLRVD